MSIKLMDVAWGLDMASGQKFVLLALCDNAADDGTCFPSIATIARKCSFDERSVRRHILRLEEIGIISRKQRMDATGQRSNIYHIRLSPSVNCHPQQIVTPGKLSPPANCHPAPGKLSPLTINEPSSNHYKQHTDKFSMHVDWKPSEHTFDLAKQAGVDTQLNERTTEFVSYWLTRATVLRSQTEWDHAFVRNLFSKRQKKQKTKPKIPIQSKQSEGKNYLAGLEGLNVA